MATPREAWLPRATALADRHQKVLACIFAVALLAALHQSFRIGGLPYDSGEYWSLAEVPVFGDTPSIRGYLFPTLLSPLRYLGDLVADPLLVIRLALPLVYGLILPLALPACFTHLFGGKVTFMRRLAPVVLLAALFPGVLLYPLSDLPALLMALGALYLASRGFDEQAKVRGALFRLALAGILMGAAYNTRTIYLFALMGLVVFAAFRAMNPASRLPRCLGVSAVIFGALAISLPQAIVNQRMHGSPGLAVRAVVHKHSLYASQLVWGMAIQRYETTVSNESPAPTVFYLDPAGEQLVRKAMASGDPYSLPFYLKFVAQHPVDFLALYVRHAINGLDVRDGIVYTTKPSPLRLRTALFNFCLLALACWVAWSIRSRGQVASQTVTRPTGASWAFPLAILLLPVAAILPGAVETRFFLPLHLLSYCLIAFRLDGAALRESLRRHGTMMVIALVGAAAVFFAVSLSTMAQIQYAWPRIYTDGPSPK
ncbi:MAG: hypothetical protein ABIR26_18645 [Ramlibacter sp.]